MARPIHQDQFMTNELENKTSSGDLFKNFETQKLLEGYLKLKKMALSGSDLETGLPKLSIDQTKQVKDFVDKKKTGSIDLELGEGRKAQLQFEDGKLKRSYVNGPNGYSKDIEYADSEDGKPLKAKSVIIKDSTGTTRYGYDDDGSLKSKNINGADGWQHVEYSHGAPKRASVKLADGTKVDQTFVVQTKETAAQKEDKNFPQLEEIALTSARGFKDVYSRDPKSGEITIESIAPPADAAIKGKLRPPPALQ